MRYDIVLCDPPWWYKPTGTYNQTGASTHYPLMTDNELMAFDIKQWMNPNAALFLWATCPRLDFALQCIKSWGLYYRGIAFIWIKTNLNGKIMGAKGPPPAFVKPVSELVLVATTIPSGRVFPIIDFTVGQIILSQRRAHSEKPDEVADNIVRLCGERSRIELFARKPRLGWDIWGNDTTGKQLLMPHEI